MPWSFADRSTTCSLRLCCRPQSAGCDGHPAPAEYGPTDYAAGGPGFQFENLNPDLPDNPDWLAGQAVTTVVSPDKKTLLVLTSGYNRVYRTNLVNGILQPDALGTYFNWPDSQEYVFVYDISTNTPVKKQVVTVPNTYNGIAFDPSGTAFYVSSGMGDAPFDSTGALNPAQSAGDNVHVFTLDAATGAWAADRTAPAGPYRGQRPGRPAAHRPAAPAEREGRRRAMRRRRGHLG